MAIPLHKGVGGNLKRFVASEPVEVPGDLKVTGNTNLPLQNASIVETIDIDVSSTGTVVSLDLEKSGGGNLTVQLSEDWLTYTAGSVNLTAGSDIAPQINYVYIEDQTGTATLVASTVGWPVTEHAPVATVLVQSAASAQTDGAYKVNAWTDHLKATNDMGHLAHINFWIRQQQATYISGVVQTLDIQSGPDPDDVFFSNTAGEVLQLHPHAFPTDAKKFNGCQIQRVQQEDTDAAFDPVTSTFTHTHTHDSLLPPPSHTHDSSGCSDDCGY